jgi:hypothetical protein
MLTPATCRSPVATRLALKTELHPARAHRGTGFGGLHSSPRSGGPRRGTFDMPGRRRDASRVARGDWPLRLARSDRRRRSERVSWRLRPRLPVRAACIPSTGLDRPRRGLAESRVVLGRRDRLRVGCSRGARCVTRVPCSCSQPRSLGYPPHHQHRRHGAHGADENRKADGAPDRSALRCWAPRLAGPLEIGAREELMLGEHAKALLGGAVHRPVLITAGICSRRRPRAERGDSRLPAAYARKGIAVSSSVLPTAGVPTRTDL